MDTDILTGTGPGSLSQALDFDRIIKITSNGEIDTEARCGHHAPEIIDPAPYELAHDGWSLITSGLTGQDSYSGPWLHNSEVIEGGVARAILAHAQNHQGGYYVAIYGEYECSECGGAGLVRQDDEEVPCPNVDCEPGHTEIDGWAVAYRALDS